MSPNTAACAGAAPAVYQEMKADSAVVARSLVVRALCRDFEAIEVLKSDRMHAFRADVAPLFCGRDLIPRMGAEERARVAFEQFVEIRHVVSRVDTASRRETDHA